MLHSRTKTMASEKRGTTTTRFNHHGSQNEELSLPQFAARVGGSSWHHEKVPVKKNTLPGQNVLEWVFIHPR